MTGPSNDDPDQHGTLERERSEFVKAKRPYRASKGLIRFIIKGLIRFLRAL